MEIQVFGDIPKRAKNPVAMQYDRVRNGLVMYKGYKDPEYLNAAIEDFSKIKQPKR